MSSNGLMMASGDRNGNLRVHDMNTWETLTYQEAHDSEILSIDLTASNIKGNLDTMGLICLYLLILVIRCTKLDCNSK